MQEVGPTIPYYFVVVLWMVKIVVLALVCSFLCWLGIRVLDALTPKIHKREKLGENPISVGLFIAGFFIFIGLIIHGAMTTPTVVGLFFDPRRLGIIAISFFVSLLLGIALFNLMDKLTPKIPFLSIENNPIAVGLDVFGYLIFFGLIIHAALTMPL